MSGSKGLADKGITNKGITNKGLGDPGLGGERLAQLATGTSGRTDAGATRPTKRTFPNYTGPQIDQLLARSSLAPYIRKAVGDHVHYVPWAVFVPKLRKYDLSHGVSDVEGDIAMIGTSGFTEKDTSWVAVHDVTAPQRFAYKLEETCATGIHEALHLLTSRRFQARVHRYTNEMVTEYFARYLADDLPDEVQKGTLRYVNAIALVKPLVEVFQFNAPSGTSKDASDANVAPLARAYFLGTVSTLENQVDSFLGTGAFAKWNDDVASAIELGLTSHGSRTDTAREAAQAMRLRTQRARSAGRFFREEPGD